MYPILKLAGVLLSARFRDKIMPSDKSVLNFWVGPADVDMFLEMNNARYLTYMELGRWDYSFRVGFLRLMRKNMWGVTAGGASIRYRRRITPFSRFALSTVLVCHDGRWFYFLQDFHVAKKACASGLIKIAVTSSDGLVPTAEVMNRIGGEVASEVPDWVHAWAEAEELRPWSTSQ
jgi:acyl-CoA thioesterase FadM